MKVAYSSSLPSELIEELEAFATKLDIPKNKLIELSIQNYLHKLKQAEYIQSFQRVGEDEEQAELAEAGLDDFLKLVDAL